MTAVINQKIRFNPANIFPARRNIFPTINFRKILFQTEIQNLFNITAITDRPRTNAKSFSSFCKRSAQPSRKRKPTISAPSITGTPSVSPKSKAIRFREFCVINYQSILRSRKRNACNLINPSASSWLYAPASSSNVTTRSL